MGSAQGFRTVVFTQCFVFVPDTPRVRRRLVWPRLSSVYGNSPEDNFLPIPNEIPGRIPGGISAGVSVKNPVGISGQISDKIQP